MIIKKENFRDEVEKHNRTHFWEENVYGDDEEFDKENELTVNMKSWTYTVRLALLFIVLVILSTRYDRPNVSYAFSISNRFLPVRTLPPLMDDDTVITIRTSQITTKLSAVTIPSEEFLKGSDDQSPSMSTNTTTKRTYSKTSAVSRIKQAALYASALAAREQQKDNIQLKNSFFSNYSPLTS